MEWTHTATSNATFGHLVSHQENQLSMNRALIKLFQFAISILKGLYTVKILVAGSAEVEQYCLKLHVDGVGTRRIGVAYNLVHDQFPWQRAILMFVLSVTMGLSGLYNAVLFEHLTILSDSCINAYFPDRGHSLVELTRVLPSVPLLETWRSSLLTKNRRHHVYHSLFCITFWLVLLYPVQPNTSRQVVLLLAQIETICHDTTFWSWEWKG